MNFEMKFDAINGKLVTDLEPMAAIAREEFGLDVWWNSDSGLFSGRDVAEQYTTGAEEDSPNLAAWREVLRASPETPDTPLWVYEKPFTFTGRKHLVVN